MFFDTAHNSRAATYRNIRKLFVETASKMWAYARCLPKDKQPQPRLVISAIQELIGVSFQLLTGASRKARYPKYQCRITKTQMAWIALHAFRDFLRTKQSSYKPVLVWLDDEIRVLQAAQKTRKAKARLEARNTAR